MIYGKHLTFSLILASVLPASALGQNVDRAGWHEHRIRQGDGKGGWVTRPAQRHVLKHPDGYWVDGKCGHIGSVVLPDGHIISAYGQYLLGASVLIKWKPDAGLAKPVLD
jgi:hypothetical protein